MKRLSQAFFSLERLQAKPVSLFSLFVTLGRGHPLFAQSLLILRVSFYGLACAHLEPSNPALEIIGLRHRYIVAEALKDSLEVLPVEDFLFSDYSSSSLRLKSLKRCYAELNRR